MEDLWTYSATSIFQEFLYIYKTLTNHGTSAYYVNCNINFLFQDQLPVNENDIYQAVARLWSPWLQPEAVVTLRKGVF